MLYKSYRPEEMILRDHLAVDRTVLANDRTMLAFIRTGLGFAITGGTLVEFLESLASDIVGAVVIGLGGVVTAVGAYRYLVMLRRLSVLRRLNVTPLDSRPTEPTPEAALIESKRLPDPVAVSADSSARADG